MENKEYDTCKLLLSTNNYSFEYKKCIVILWCLSFFFFFLFYICSFLTFLFIYLKMWLFYIAVCMLGFGDDIIWWEDLNLFIYIK